MSSPKFLIDYTKPQTFSQTDNIRDHIFPLVKVKITESKYIEGLDLIGTGFLIGSRGHGLTAAHVIEQCFNELEKNEAVVAIFWNMFSEFVAFQVTAHEKHPTEDVGILKLSHDDFYSILEISDTYQNASCEYTCWGYPKEIAEEIKKLYKDAHQQPDLIYTQGYIRRRITRELFPTMIFRGTQFYELSEQVGEGNSGGPVIWRKSVGSHKWQIIGIDIGEKEEGKISYAVRADAFFGWRPTLLKGITVREESKSHRTPAGT
jgi:hypothetical protein